GIRDFHVTGVQTCALPIFGNNDIALGVNLAGDFALNPENALGFQGSVKKSIFADYGINFRGVDLFAFLEHNRSAHSRQVFYWIYRLAPVPHLIMEVGPGGITAVAHIADDIPRLHCLSDFYRNLALMRIVGAESIAVFNNYQVAVTGSVPGKFNGAFGSGINFAAVNVSAGNINTGMEIRFPGDGMSAPPKRRGDKTPGRPAGRRRRSAALLLLDGFL